MENRSTTCKSVLYLVRRTYMFVLPNTVCFFLTSYNRTRASSAELVYSAPRYIYTVDTCSFDRSTVRVLVNPSRLRSHLPELTKHSSMEVRIYVDLFVRFRTFVVKLRLVSVVRLSDVYRFSSDVRR